MRIAQISPLFESVPPKLYGGTERVVSWLTEELARAGHEVVLFASADSETSAELVPMCKRALRLDPHCTDPGAYHFLVMEEVLRRAHEFDIIHSHIDYIGFVLARRTKTPVVSTTHGRLDFFEHALILNEYSELPLISISNAQRTPVPSAHWIDTIYHGLPRNLYTFRNEPGEYLAFVGRVSPEKKVDKAIEVALKAEIPLKIAAKVDRADKEYYEKVIRPLLRNSLIEYLGEINDKEKNELLGNAFAFLYPIDWPEPFGIGMIEAMACGTPVIARRKGSVPEVVDHGITGFSFTTVEEAVLQIKNKVSLLSRKKCHEQFEKRFLSARMSKDYCHAYENLLFKETRKPCLRQLDSKMNII